MKQIIAHVLVPFHISYDETHEGAREHALQRAISLSTGHNGWGFGNHGSHDVKQTGEVRIIATMDATPEDVQVASVNYTDKAGKVVGTTKETCERLTAPLSKEFTRADHDAWRFLPVGSDWFESLRVSYRVRNPTFRCDRLVELGVLQTHVELETDKSGRPTGTKRFYRRNILTPEHPLYHSSPTTP